MISNTPPDGTELGAADEINAPTHPLPRLASAPGADGALVAACRSVLLTPDPRAKIMLARRVARDWRLGRIAWSFAGSMPDRPAPGPAPVMSAARVPSRGRAGSLASRIAILHALAHIEYVAVDLAFDLVGRFGRAFPVPFVDEWLRVAADEAMHFAILDRRLATLGSGYGVLPVHGGLWQAAELTADDALARLAVVPMVLEARALDVSPQTIDRFEKGGDPISARLLRRILNDEIRHVAAGVRWFQYLADQAGIRRRWNVAAAGFRAIWRRFEAAIQRLGARTGRFDDGLLYVGCPIGLRPTDLNLSLREGQFFLRRPALTRSA